MAEQAHGDDDRDESVVARSFVVRALLEDETRTGASAGSRPGAAPSRWHGFVTDAQTGARSVWRRPSDVSRFIERRLAEDDSRIATGASEPAGVGPVRLGGLAMAGPALTDVVADMLATLGDRLPAPVPAVPVPNVTIERVAEKLIGLGNHAGSQPASPIGTRTLRGGRLDARVRFQLWAGSPPAVDSAMQSVHSTLLDDSEELRALGFLKLKAAGTTLAEHVETIPAWRKASSFDVLYEYSYTDTDDAASLIVSIPVTTDSGQPDAPQRELSSVVDEVIRWDNEAAPPLVVRGPAAISRISALTFVPGPPLAGTVTFARTSGTGAPATSFADFDTFLAAISGASPTHSDADLTLPPAAALVALGLPVGSLSLGDWDIDGTVDDYTGTDRRIDAPIALASAAERFELRYTPPAGPATGLNQTAVIYLRVNQP